MSIFRKDIKIVVLTMAAAILFAGASLRPASAQIRLESVYNGHRIIYPGSSIPVPGRIHTNYFFVDSDKGASLPPAGSETPGSVACVYKLVAGPTGCPIATSTTVPSGGIGAIAIVDAGYYPPRSPTWTPSTPSMEFRLRPSRRSGPCLALPRPAPPLTRTGRSRRH